MANSWTGRSNTELAEWLDANTWFEDAEPTEVTPAPADAANPTTLTIGLTEQVKGTYLAGTDRVVRDIEVYASELNSTTLGPELTFSPGGCCEGMSLMEAEQGIAFEIDVPSRLEVRCSLLRITLGEQRTERVKPWLSDDEFALTLPGAATPSPEEWLNRFAALGLAVQWRMYGEPSAGVPPNPADYTGWHLQVPERIKTTNGGLFFFACGQRDNALVLQVSMREDSDGGMLWEVACKVGAGFPGAEIQCGNCLFSTDEWQEYLQSGQLPVGSHR